MLLASCGGSVLPPEPVSEGDAPILSGEAGTATIRIERDAHITGKDLRWEVYGEFPITLYFGEEEDSPIFTSTGKGTGVMAGVDVGMTGITAHTTVIFDVDFEVKGAF